MEKISVCVIGSGIWASAVAKIVGKNSLKLDDFEDRVNFHMTEEPFQEKQTIVSDIVLPENVVIVNNLVESARYADVIVFVMIHSVLPSFCKILLGKIKPDALAITLTRGFISAEDGSLQLASHTVMKYLKVPCAVMMTSNLVKTLTSDSYSELTLGCRDAKYSKLFESIFRTPNFRVAVVDDADCVEVCGLIKNIVSFGAGLLDGFDCNANTKSACIRFGLMEMIRFIDVFYPGCKLSTFFESCGFSDLVGVCHCSRNRRLAEILVKTGIPLDELEKEILGGEKIIGPLVLNSVSVMLKQKGLENQFPLFTTIHKICQCTLKPEELLNCMRNIPDINYHPSNTFPL